MRSQAISTDDALPLVRLPELAGDHFQRRQPVPSVTVAVDALQVAEVKDLLAPLRGVPDDDGFSLAARRPEEVARLKAAWERRDSGTVKSLRGGRPG